VKYSTIWSEDFTDHFFRSYLTTWLKSGHAKHKTPHVQRLKSIKVGGKERKLAESLASQLQRERSIMESSTRDAWGCSMLSSPMSFSIHWVFSKNDSPNPRSITRRRRFRIEKPMMCAGGWGARDDFSHRPA